MENVSYGESAIRGKCHMGMCHMGKVSCREIVIWGICHMEKLSAGETVVWGN